MKAIPYTIFATLWFFAIVALIAMWRELKAWIKKRWFK